MSNQATDIARLADQVIAKEELRGIKISSLRALIEAVQNHPKAVIAPVQAQRTIKWEPIRKGEGSLTRIKIHNCEIEEAECDSVDIRISIHCSDSSFNLEPSFQATWFAGDVNFDGTNFGLYASFRTAKFQGHASFDNVSFAHADFMGALFNKRSGFREADITLHGNFCGADFRGTAFFDRAKFTDCDFSQAR